MRLGVVFPQTEIGNEVHAIREFATTIEQAGYEHVVAYDHVLGHRPGDRATWDRIGPYTDEHSFHEVLVLLAYLAALTKHLELVTEVLILPQRQTVLVAKQAAEIQLLSGGRLRLGVGVGWNPEEYRALGMNFRDRGQRISEQIEVMRRLWIEDLVSFAGDQHSIRSSGIQPRPPQTIPIWMGGTAPIVLQRAADIADGFTLDEDLEGAPAILAQLMAYLGARNRDPSAFGIAGRVRIDPDNLDASARKALEWKALGVTHLSVITMNVGLSDPRDHARLALDFMSAWRSLN